LKHTEFVIVIGFQRVEFLAFYNSSRILHLYFIVGCLKKNGPLRFRHKIKTIIAIQFIFADIVINIWEQVKSKFHKAAIRIIQELEL